MCVLMHTFHNIDDKTSCLGSFTNDFWENHPIASNSRDRNIMCIMIHFTSCVFNIHITQYGSTMYIGMAMGGSAL